MSYNLLPTGVVLPFAGTATPEGYLACDGTAVSRSTYAALFAAIGVAHGSGNGSTTFNIPDYRGRFLRGVDGTAGRDPNDSTRTAMNTGGNTGDNVGSVQADAFQGHYHTGQGSTAAGGASNALVRGTSQSTGGGILGPTAQAGALDPIADSSNGTPRTSSETRPINAYVNYIIKF
jgi:microcystin-dependent protein